MKKIILLVIALFLTVTSVVTAINWEESKKLPNGSYQELTSWGFKENKVRVFKFQDDKTICYVIYPILPNGTIYNTEMECNIK